MGAWGYDAFDNDTACDWALRLNDVADLSAVEDALARVVDVGEAYLDDRDACEALAACEVIARLRGHCGARNVYTMTVDAWVAAHPIEVSDELAQRAVDAIDRIMQSPSELLEIWDANGEASGWHASVADLRSRVAPRPVPGNSTH